MRVTRRILAVIALLAAAAMLLPNHLPWEARTVTAPEPRGQGQRVFVAYPDRPLTFAVSRRSRIMRFFLNAALSGVAPGETLRNDYYELEIEWLDADGRVIGERSWAHRLQVSWFVRDGRLVAGRELLGVGEDVVTADSNLMYLPVPEAQPAAVRLRPSGDASQYLVALGVRAYGRERLRRAEIERRLERLAPDARERLAEASAYEWQLLSGRERRNAMRYRWRALAPRGNPGLDYAEDRLIVRDAGDPLVEPLISRPRPDVLLPGRALTVALRDRENRLTVRTDPVGQMPAAVHARWFPRGGEPRQVPLESGRPVDLELGRGMLELRADGPIRFALRGTDGEAREPEWRYLRVWLASPVTELEYPLAADEEALPLRIDARVLSEEGWKDGGEVSVRYELRGAGGAAIDSAVLRWQAEPSPYAWIDAAPASVVSEPRRIFLSVPRGTHSIVFRASRTLALAVYDRPNGLVRRLRIPDGLYGGDPHSDRVPDWFLLRPKDHESLLRKGGSRLLTLTPRTPREADRELRAEPYRLLPEGDWRGIEVLEPVTRDSPWSPRQFTPVLRPAVQLVSGLGDTAATPRLLLRRDPERARRVWVDGTLAGERSPGPGWSEVSLPRLAAGEHRIRLDPPGEAWINSTLPGVRRATVRLLQRLAVDGILSYPIERRPMPAERVSLRVYGTSPDVESAELSIELEGIAHRGGPQDAWTFSETRASIALDPLGPLPVVTGPEKGPVSMGRASIELGSDLARCGCRLRISNRGAPIFVAVTRSPPPGMPAQSVASEALYADGH